MTKTQKLKIELLNLIDQLKRHEGLSLRVYQCSSSKLTIGYGRNLEDRGITKPEAEMLLINDIEQIEIELANRVPVFTSGKLSQARMGVLVNMAFNLGVTGLIRFKKMIACLELEDFEGAGREMLDSKWASQVGLRAVELSRQMITGEYA